MMTLAERQELYDKLAAAIEENGRLTRALVGQSLDEKDRVIAEQAALLRDAREWIVATEYSTDVDGVICNGCDAFKQGSRIARLQHKDDCKWAALLARMPS